MRANHVLAAGSALALVLFAARDASACSCASASRVVNPETGMRHVPGLPLVHYSNVATATLRDGSGTELELLSIRELNVSGVCGGIFRFLAPSPPFDPNAEYTVVPEPEFLDQAWVEEHTVPFVTGSASVTRAPIRLELTATLNSLQPHEPSGGGCGDPAFIGRVIQKGMSVVLMPSSPAVLFVTLSMDDPVAGVVSDTGTTWRGPRDMRPPGAAVGMPMPDDAPSCVDVSVVDLSGEELLLESFCPALGETMSVTKDTSAVVLPKAHAARDEAGAGSGCHMSRGTRTQDEGLLLAALLALHSVRRRASRLRSA